MCPAADYLAILGAPAIIGFYAGGLTAMVLAARREPIGLVMREAERATFFTGVALLGPSLLAFLVQLAFGIG